MAGSRRGPGVMADLGGSGPSVAQTYREPKHTSWPSLMNLP